MIVTQREGVEPPKKSTLEGLRHFPMRVVSPSCTRGSLTGWPSTSKAVKKSELRRAHMMLSLKSAKGQTLLYRWLIADF